MGSADLQSPQKLVAAFNACNVKQQVDGPGSDLWPVLCVGLDGIQHLFFIFVTTYLVMKHVTTTRETRQWDPRLSAVQYLATSSSPLCLLLCMLECV